MALILVTSSSPVSLQPGMFRRIRWGNKWGRKENSWLLSACGQSQISTVFPLLANLVFLQAVAYCVSVTHKRFFCPRFYLNFLWNDLNFCLPKSPVVVSFHMCKMLPFVTLPISAVLYALCCKRTWVGPCKMACAAKRTIFLRSQWLCKPHSWGDLCSWFQCHTMLIASKRNPL